MIVVSLEQVDGGGDFGFSACAFPLALAYRDSQNSEGSNIFPL